MDIIKRIAAFTYEGKGGNPAGVMIAETLPHAEEMQRIAAEIGYSETAFAAPLPDRAHFRVRYFAPETEVPFCGHATIALGVELGHRFGEGRYLLTLNDYEIEVTAQRSQEEMTATLSSPPTDSRAAPADMQEEAMALFDLADTDLDNRYRPTFAQAGATHLLLFLRSRSRLSAMDYDLAQGRDVMRRYGLVTISLLVAEGERRFSARNAFASGGVLEDPATGAAAAALGGMLRDTGRLNGGEVRIMQGVDMGRPSELIVTLTAGVGSPVKVTGFASRIKDQS